MSKKKNLAIAQALESPAEPEPPIPPEEMDSPIRKAVMPEMGPPCWICNQPMIRDMQQSPKKIYHCERCGTEDRLW